MQDKWRRATGWRRGGRTSAASLHHVMHCGGVSWPQRLWLYLTTKDWPMEGRKQGHQTEWPGPFSQDPEDALWCGELISLNCIHEHVLGRCLFFWQSHWLREQGWFRVQCAAGVGWRRPLSQAAVWKSHSKFRPVFSVSSNLYLNCLFVWFPYSKLCSF